MTYVRLPQVNDAEGATLTGSAANCIMYTDASMGESTLSTFSFKEDYSLMGVGTASPAARMHISGALSSPNALSVTGVGFAADASTITDTVSSGTVASAAVHSLGVPTLAASAATTYTNSATLYIAGATVAGTNVTATNKFALWIAGGNIKLGVGDVVLDTVTGTTIGTATAQKLAFHAATPVIQRAGEAQAAVVTTSATQSTPYGFATQAQADAIVTLVNELRAALVEKGLIKGAA